MFKQTLLLVALNLSLANAQKLPRVRAQPGGHYLQTQRGGSRPKPFFWLGDTDWELFHRLTRDEVDQFLTIRKEQGFNVLQAVALAEFDGLTQPNAYGDLPLLTSSGNFDPTQPALTPGSNPTDSAQYDYWDHVDYVVKRAGQLGLYVAILPTWGDKVTKGWGTGPVVFNQKNAHIYGQFIGKRYAKATNVIWMLGGDRPATLPAGEAARRKRDPYDHRPVWRAMAAGIRDGVGSNVPMLVTYHTWGGRLRTAQEIGDEPWLHMNSMQSGHGGGHDVPVWEWIEADYKRTPAKPTLDLEPNYEDHPVNPWPKWDPKNGYFSAYDVRKQTWRSVLAGGAGVTYGHHFIWQFYDRNQPNRPPINNGDTLITWQQAARSEAAQQMRYLRRLIESRPQFERIPDQSLLASATGAGGEHIQACRSSRGTWAFVYLPVSKSLSINTGTLAGRRIKAAWYDPRTGQYTDAGTSDKQPTQAFVPPTNGPDWVLVLEGVK